MAVTVCQGSETHPWKKSTSLVLRELTKYSKCAATSQNMLSSGEHHRTSTVGQYHDLSSTRLFLPLFVFFVATKAMKTW